MNTQNQNTGSYGEPWRHNGGDFVSTKTNDSVAYFMGPYNKRDRAIQCVNACQGIADPAKAIQDAREALETFVKRFTPVEQDLIFSKRDALRKARLALAQLNNA